MLVLCDVLMLMRLYHIPPDRMRARHLAGAAGDVCALRHGKPVARLADGRTVHQRLAGAQSLLLRPREDDGAHQAVRPSANRTEPVRRLAKYLYQTIWWLSGTLSLLALYGFPSDLW